jgi:hypothetical protein
MPAPTSLNPQDRQKKRLDWKVLVISRKALYTWTAIISLLIVLSVILVYTFRETGIGERAKEAIASAEKAIRKAANSGAETFAYEKYSQAVLELSKARKFLGAGDFKTAYDHAIRAESLARRAEVELAEQGITASRFATVSGMSGKVEVKRSKDLSWQPVSPGMKFSTDDQIRTFADSQVQITFDDASVLRVKPNSLIVMGNLSEDVTTSTRKTSVRLMASDIEANIKKSGAQISEFKIETPNAVTQAEKANLAVQVSPDLESRIRVFSGTADVASGGKTVRVGTNQEVAVTKNHQVISSTHALAPPPNLISPTDMKQFTFSNPQQGKVALAWTEVPGARAYHLEVGQDQFFFDPTLDLKTLPNVVHEVEKLAAGTYFWRVSSINAQGSEGGFSDQEVFQIRYAAEGVPFRIDNLLVLTGSQGNMLHIQGTTEQFASIEVNDILVHTNEDGRFLVRLKNVPKGKFVISFRVVTKKGTSATFQQEIPVGIGS